MVAGEPLISGSLARMLQSQVRVGERTIGGGAPPFVIAEVGSNHHNDVDQAMRLIDAAAEAGADAVKFQLFRADALYPRDSEMWRRFRSIELPVGWLPGLGQHANTRGLQMFASVFDVPSLEGLLETRPPAIKIASSEATNLGLLERCAQTGLPLFLSTGMCDLLDVQEAVDVCVRAGNESVVLMQCGAVYPLQPDQANLRVMDLYRDLFACPVGLSDHTLGTAVPIGAVGRGAEAIEKHLTLDRNAGGPDDFYALEPAELRDMIRAIRDVHAALGERRKDLLPSEREFGRRDGVYAVLDIPAGAVLTLDSVEARRPATDIRARYLSRLVGATLRRAIRAGEPIRWSDLQLP